MRSGSAYLQEAGFILVPVLLITLLLAAVAAAFLASSRTSLLTQKNLAASAAADAAADGMSRLAAFRLSASDGSGLQTNGTTVFCRWNDQAIAAYAIQDQGGLVDINTASPSLLLALLAGAGGNDALANDIFGAIQDFRDMDRVTQQGLAEPNPYQGRNFGPKNAPFAVIEELDQVPEVQGDVLGKIRAMVTVYSQQAGIDPAVVPEALRQTLAPAFGNDLAQVSSPSAKKTFSITATARLFNGTQFTRHAMVALTQQPDRPFVFLEWRRSRSSAENWPEPETLAPCFN